MPEEEKGKKGIPDWEKEYKDWMKISATKGGQENPNPKVDDTDYQLELSKKLTRGVDNLTAAEIYKKLIGGGEPRPEPAFQLKGNLDIGNMFGSSQEMLKSMLEAKDQALTSARQATSDAERRFWDHMVTTFGERVSEMKEALSKAQANREDPLDVYKRVKAITDEVRTELAKSLGVPRETIQDPKLALDLKRIELDGMREDRKFQYLMAQDQRKWDLELEKFKEDRQQRWAEAQLKQQQSKELVAGIERVAETVARVAEARKAEQMGTVPDNVQQTVPNNVQQTVPVICDECGAHFTASPSSEAVTCPQCQVTQPLRKPSPSEHAISI